jgi:hypothetical protein
MKLILEVNDVSVKILIRNCGLIILYRFSTNKLVINLLVLNNSFYVAF